LVYEMVHRRYEYCRRAKKHYDAKQGAKHPWCTKWSTDGTNIVEGPRNTMTLREKHTFEGIWPKEAKAPAVIKPLSKEPKAHVVK
jgi:hypothetical protein